MVALVGAGPGDPGLITCRGLELLRRADVVIYDALANPKLLDEAPPQSEKIDVGKRAGRHRLSQEKINELLVQKAKQTTGPNAKTASLLVVRLKGGDPYLFGRGAEEVAYLGRHNVRCEVVPGVTAGIAAPATGGIPVTHRQMASTVTFVTGHEDPTKAESSVDYAALAALLRCGGTICFYMGVGRLEAISQALQCHGCEPTTPLAIVQDGTLPTQRVLRTTLGKVTEDRASAAIAAPAIVVAGQVARIDEPGLDAFMRRPLFGSQVVVTRTRQQASELSSKLAELGANVLEAPTIELAEPVDWAPVDRAIKQIKDFDWLVLTSVNGVAALSRRLDVLKLDARHLAGLLIAVIGDATAKAVRTDLGIAADLMPEHFVAEALAKQLIAQGVAKKKLLLLRADIARPALPKLLGDAGAEVLELAIYETQLAPALPDTVMEGLQAGRIDWVTFTSSSTARNFVELLGAKRAVLGSIKTASIGPITSKTMRELGLEVTVEATTSNIDGLVEAMVKNT